jgi:UDP-N-acetylglucosamine kinase
MDQAEWARKNKKRIAREFIRRVELHKSVIPVGIYTAGLPGAGKTEFTVELLKGIINKPLRIDMDEIAALMEGYRPETADKFRGGASMILAKIYDEVIKHKVDFVFDGTFSQDRALENLDRAIHHGYKVKIYYIHQDPVIAWQFTKDRELIEHRAIEKQGFIETYLKLYKNLKALQKNYKNVTISVVIKDENNVEGRRIEDVKDLFDELPGFLTSKQLEDVIL